MRLKKLSRRRTSDPGVLEEESGAQRRCLLTTESADRDGNGALDRLFVPSETGEGFEGQASEL